MGSNQALLKATSLPHYLVYALFSSNRDLPLTWCVKYALLRLLDLSLNSEEAILNLILSVGVMVNNSIVNTMEYVFNLVDSKSTVEFGAALITVMLLQATSDASINTPRASARGTSGSDFFLMIRGTPRSTRRPSGRLSTSS